MAGGCLVVGYGSIGARHARLLRALDRPTAVVSGREVEFAPLYDNLDAALDAEQPDYVVVSNDTARHHETLARLATLGFEGTVLVEKPLFERARAIPENRFRGLYVGYNLRFHPVFRALRESMNGDGALSAQAYVGQHLAGWWPGRDYRATASASAERGGGVLRDLSHELDLLFRLFGPWRRLAALGGAFSNLEIDSDDAWALLLELDGCPAATLQLNYLDRGGRRDLIVIGEDHSYHADLSGGALTVDGECVRFDMGADDSYLAQHKAVLEQEGAGVCTLEEGLAVVDAIEAAERAASEGRWVET